MTQKIIVSDTDNAHATTMKNNILDICPTAQVDIRIETFAASVTYAIDNGYHGISRSTTGLSDLRVVSDGKRAWDAGVWTANNGYNLYLEKHTSKKRMDNAFDIITNKDLKFKGFIK